MQATLEPRGTHILGDHAQHVADQGRACRPDTHTPQQAEVLMEAILQCIELVGGATAASRLNFDSSPDKVTFGNRSRSNPAQAAPMNPVHRHYGAGASGRPGGDSDTGYWRHEYQRVDNHYDRCDAVRRAAAYLAGLIARDPNATAGEWTDDDTRAEVLLAGQGWDLKVVAERFRLNLATVAHYRIDAGRHPLTGKHWQPPTENRFMAEAAREMKQHGLTSTTISMALQCSASAVRMWTSGARRAA